MMCECGCNIHKRPGLILHNVDQDDYIHNERELDWECSSGQKSTLSPLRCINGSIVQPDCIGVISASKCVRVKPEQITGDVHKLSCVVRKEYYQTRLCSLTWFNNKTVIAELDEHMFIINTENSERYNVSIFENEDTVDFMLFISDATLDSFKCVLRDNHGNHVCEYFVDKQDTSSNRDQGFNDPKTSNFPVMYVVLGVVFGFILSVLLACGLMLRRRCNRQRKLRKPTIEQMQIEILSQDSGFDERRARSGTSGLTTSSKDGENNHGKTVEADFDPRLHTEQMQIMAQSQVTRTVHRYKTRL